MRSVRPQAGCLGAALTALVMYLSCAAYAGMAPAGGVALPSDHLSTVAEHAVPCAAAAVQSLGELDAFLPGGAHGLHGLERPAVALPDESTPSPATLRELPPAPSSMSLVLSALASLGAYQGVRSFKRLHVSFTPDWYHTGGPAQVGHATPLNLEFSALPICAFDEPAARPASAYRIPRELRSRLRSQFFLLVESPRGPPLSA